MSQKKTLQELTFKDNFMFGAVLLDPENCKGVIERSEQGITTARTQHERTNEDEVPEALVKFLKFVGAQPSESEKDYEDAFIVKR